MTRKKEHGLHPTTVVLNNSANSHKSPSRKRTFDETQQTTSDSKIFLPHTIEISTTTTQKKLTLIFDEELHVYKAQGHIMSDAYLKENQLPYLRSVLTQTKIPCIAHAKAADIKRSEEKNTVHTYYNFIEDKTYIWLQDPENVLNSLKTHKNITFSEKQIEEEKDSWPVRTQPETRKDIGKSWYSRQWIASPDRTTMSLTCIHNINRSTNHHQGAKFLNSVRKTIQSSNIVNVVLYSLQDTTTPMLSVDTAGKLNIGIRYSVGIFDGTATLTIPTILHELTKRSTKEEKTKLVTTTIQSLQNQNITQHTSQEDPQTTTTSSSTNPEMEAATTLTLLKNGHNITNLTEAENNHTPNNDNSLSDPITAGRYTQARIHEKQQQNGTHRS